MSTKRTYQPKKRRRARVHGFRSKMRTRGGRAVVVGVSGEPIKLGPAITFAFFKTQLLGSYGYTRKQLQTLVRLTESGRLDLHRSISATLPFDQAEEAVRMLRTKENAPVRILLVSGDSSLARPATSGRNTADQR